MTSPTILSLGSLPDKTTFTSSNFPATHAPPAMIHSVWTTLQLLSKNSPALSFAPTNFSLLNPNLSEDQLSTPRVLSYLEELSRASFEVASSLLCSSVLAGRSSESDDYGDVGVWIGDLAKAEPGEVLQSLGLDKWVSSKKGKVCVYLASINTLDLAFASRS